MADLPYMPLYVSDYLSATEDLTAEESGVYLRLLMHCWRRGGYLRYDMGRLAMLSGVSVDTMNKIWDGPVGGFFDATPDGNICNRRVLEELTKAAETTDRRRAAAVKASAAAASSRSVQTVTDTVTVIERTPSRSSNGDRHGDQTVTVSVPKSESESEIRSRDQSQKAKGECEGGADAPSAIALVPVKAPSRKPRKAKEPTDESRWVGRVMAVFATKWQAKYGVTYRPDGRDSAAVGRLLSLIPDIEDRQQIPERMDRYLRDDTRWNVEEIRHGLWHFAASWNKYGVDAIAPTDNERRGRLAGEAWLAAKEAEDRAANADRAIEDADDPMLLEAL